MASFAEFGRRMKRRGKNLSGNVGRIMRAAALAVDREVVLATPVDTGRARSNWIVSIGSPRGGVINAYSPHAKYSGGGGQGTSEGANAAAAMNQGAAAIATQKNNKVIYIQNNLHYIADLNNGSSAQAPRNFMAIAAKVGLNTVRRNAKNLLK